MTERIGTGMNGAASRMRFGREIVMRAEFGSADPAVATSEDIKNLRSSRASTGKGPNKAFFELNDKAGYIKVFVKSAPGTSYQVDFYESYDPDGTEFHNVPSISMTEADQGRIDNLFSPATFQVVPHVVSSTGPIELIVIAA